MGDKQKGGVCLFLNVLQEIYNLRLNGDIESADRFIGNNQLRLHNKGPCNTDALSLPPGKLMRIAVRMLTR
ncbi:hypothetical protein D3C81_1686660 [compost metagenome]